MSLPSQVLTVVLAVLWIVVNHQGMNFVNTYHVRGRSLRMAIDSAGAVILNLCVLLHWTNSANVLVTFIPHFFLVHIYVHSGLHQSSYTRRPGSD
jgi:hypothetical protein